MTVNTVCTDSRQIKIIDNAWFVTSCSGRVSFGKLCYGRRGELRSVAVWQVEAGLAGRFRPAVIGIGGALRGRRG